MKWYDTLKATGPFGWVSWLISAFNKNDSTFQKIGSGLESVFNKYTGSALTGAEQEANRFSAEEAQKQRDWETEMSNTAMQRQVADMQKAGLNPALMYGGTSSSGASTPSGASASSVSPSSSGITDIIGSIMDLALTKAQIQNINADTRTKDITNSNLDAQQKATIASTLASAESTKADTLYRNLLIQYGLPEAEVNKILNDIKVGDSVVSRNEAESDLAKANAAFQEVQKKINLTKLPYELANMDASARESKARAIVEEFRGAYMRVNNTDVPSGAIASLVGMLSNTVHSVASESESGWNELNSRTFFPFIDMLLNFFNK